MTSSNIYSPVIRPVRRKLEYPPIQLSQASVWPSQENEPQTRTNDSQETFFSQAEDCFNAPINLGTQTAQTQGDNPLAHKSQDGSLSWPLSPSQEENTTQNNPPTEEFFSQPKKPLPHKKSGTNLLMKTMKRLQPQIRSFDQSANCSSQIVDRNIHDAEISWKPSIHQNILELEKKVFEIESQVLAKGNSAELSLKEVIDAEAALSQIEIKQGSLETSASRSERKRLNNISSQCQELKVHLTNINLKISNSQNSQQPLAPTEKTPNHGQISQDAENYLPSLKELLDVNLLQAKNLNLELRVPDAPRVVGTLKKDGTILGTDSKIHLSVQDWCKEYFKGQVLSRLKAYSLIFSTHRGKKISLVTLSTKYQPKQNTGREHAEVIVAPKKQKKRVPLRRVQTCQRIKESQTQNRTNGKGTQNTELSSLSLINDSYDFGNQNDLQSLELNPIQIGQANEQPCSISQITNNLTQNPIYEEMEVDDVRPISLEETPPELTGWEKIEWKQEQILKLWHSELDKMEHKCCDANC
ncbi:uncharacterized protein LOC132198308 [Neocloeon triangulifer]|uniref:uncharacterized protein LOC132198308 n=1 Tax=Neocloeon triangulifer TaxID=2078957 RepID=UPI00286ECEB0|nr:uncharacterized protein LOC132198308 [Neocloeon triangulifer]